MCNENRPKLDVYNWVLSPEIREHMRTARPLTIEEKADIIDSGCRPIADKYAALTVLLQEAECEDDKTLLTDLLKLYNWVFEELHSQRLGRCSFSRRCGGRTAPWTAAPAALKRFSAPMRS